MNRGNVVYGFLMEIDTYFFACLSYMYVPFSSYAALKKILNEILSARFELGG